MMVMAMMKKPMLAWKEERREDELCFSTTASQTPYQYDDNDWSDEGPDEVSVIPQPAPRVWDRSEGL